MRWILLLLVLVNLGYFAWETYTGTSVPVRDAGVVKVIQKSGLPPVLLVSEKPATGSANTERKEPAAEREAGQGKIVLGGFDSRERIEALRQRLLSLGLDGRIVEQSLDAEMEYWVYLPPLASRAATLRLLRELQARKVDGFLIAQGELANGISLGIFPREDSAKAVQVRLLNAGYQAQIKMISRQQSAYWFEVSGESQRLLDDEMLKELLDDFEGLQHSVVL